MRPEKIRNFCIVAHIDHGKSTLSDRLIEATNAIDKRKMSDQILDSLDIEKERGITVKSAVISLKYRAKNEEEYLLNLIDTPGHVDFTYEVSRSLAACEGAILIIDGSQGIEAQTLSNFYLAFEANLTILPVINKIDLPAANIEKTSEEIEKELDLDTDNIIKISAKNNIGVEDVLEGIISIIPPPLKNTAATSTKALVFDSFFDKYRGAIICTRVFEGEIKTNSQMKLFFANKEYQVEEVGYLGLERKKRDSLKTGEVGYVILGAKSVSEIKTGDTLTNAKNPCEKPLEGYKEIKSMVFAGIYPIDSNKYQELKDAMEKLVLNDGALKYEKDNSLALGFGFRCGFLGLLHMEIVQERLSQEFNMEVIITAPSVLYQVTLSKKNNKEAKTISIDNPSKFPEPNLIESIKEPHIKASIVTPSKYLGGILKLIQERRGTQLNLRYLNEKRVEGIFELPLGEIVFDFYDKLKSITKGYASFDYELIDYRPADICKIDILINKEVVDAFSFLIHQEKARERGLGILKKLLNEIPRQMFAIPLQAAIGSTIIARETIKALRKDVTAKCYGGDISRKRKLLEKQKEGKKQMKSVGNVDIHQKTFINVLKT